MAAAPPPTFEPIDPNEDSTDSDYYSGVESETTTLASSLVNFTFENGRRYHRLGEKFTMPNDETEQSRLDLYHHLQLLVLKGNLYLAPLQKDPHFVLDCGTGTGIWALDLAETLPSAEVTGVDITPIQPCWTYSNCKFEVDDLEMEWTYPEDHFDFIHSRGLAMSIRDWPRYVEQMYKHTKPGGYIELVEHDFFARCDDGTLVNTNLQTYFDKLREGINLSGIKIEDGESLKGYAKAAGFENVTIHEIRHPMSAWVKDKQAREQGAISHMVAETGFEAYSLALFTRVLQLEPEQAKKIAYLAHRDLRNKSIHAYNRLYHVVARKPLSG